MTAKTAGEIMIPLDKYPHISYWFSTRQAIAELQHSELDINGRKSLARAVLVFDEENKMVGMVRRRDILRGLEPESHLGTHIHLEKQIYDIEIDPNLFEMSYDSFFHTVIHKGNIPVSEIMIPIAATVDFSDHIVKIIYEMNQHRQSLLPVLKNGVVVGVIRTVEVMNEIAQILNIK